MFSKNVKYTWNSFRKDQFWIIAAFLALFMLMQVFFKEDGKAYNLAISYLGVALPLLAGVLAAYAILEDPALELQFTSPQRASSFLLKKMALLLGVMALCAFVYQLFLILMQVSLSPLGGLLERQLAWLLPVVMTMTLGNLFALLTRRSTNGAALIGVLWIMQVILRGMFAAQKGYRLFFLFMSALYPENSFVSGNRISLTCLSLVFLLAGIYLLSKQERYI